MPVVIGNNSLHVSLTAIAELHILLVNYLMKAVPRKSFASIGGNTFMEQKLEPNDIATLFPLLFVAGCIFSRMTYIVDVFTKTTFVLSLFIFRKA